MKNIVDDLKSNGMLYLIIGSLISADNNNFIEEINNNIKNLKNIKEQTIKSELTSNEEKEKLLKICNDGIEILSKDLLTFEEK